MGSANFHKIQFNGEEFKIITLSGEGGRSDGALLNERYSHIAVILALCGRSLPAIRGMSRAEPCLRFSSGI